MKVTISDVAKLAGVSTATVSHTINQTRYVSEETRDKVYAAIRELEGAIYHFHAKDTRVDPYNCAANGVLDTQSFENLAGRSWIFRTVGYGTDAKNWKDMLSALRMAGYDGAISIEHEDGLMSPREGLEKAVSFLKDLLIREGTGAMWWS